MKVFTCFFGIFLSAIAINAAAEMQVIGAMGSRTAIKTYEDADGKTELAPVSVKNITFPLTVFEVSERGFVRVKLEDKQTWLNKEQVSIPPESLEATCLTANRADAGVTPGGLRGANAGCK